tara:strand:- start:148 stop:381 length:234 start_codon:yes stop_codon:yes gene_type:complete
MKLKRKYYPIASVVCFIMVLAFSSIHAYKVKSKKKEGFIEHINEFTNKSRRKLETFKKDVDKVGGEGFKAVKKLLRN